MAVATINPMVPRELPPEVIAVRKDFNERYRHTGVTAEDVLRLCGVMSFEKVAGALCEKIPPATDVGWVRQQFRELAPGERKPMARNGPRDDLTEEFLRALAANCGSISEMMAKADAGKMTIVNRAKRFGIPLPNGHAARPKPERQEAVLLWKPRRRIKPAKGRGIVIAPRSMNSWRDF